MSKFGVDISTHNGTIDFNKLKSAVDFCMIRAGYSTAVDAKFYENAKKCEQNNIPFGAYWFSYATTVEEVENEAKKCAETLKSFNVAYPVAFDWEYDSDTYFKKTVGRSATIDERCNFAHAFCKKIKEYGYTPMIYTNIDYYDNKGFKNIANDYIIWLAHWGVKTPKYSCKMWQYTSEGSVTGISGNVDLNRSYISDENLVSNNKKDTVESINKKFASEYEKIAKEIIQGKYGNGAERKKKLKSLGYDVNYAQSLVNVML